MPRHTAHATHRDDVLRAARRTTWSRTPAIAALAAAAGIALAAGTGLAAAANPAPCKASGGGRYDCRFYVPGDGRSGGSPVQASNGAVVGFRHAGTHPAPAPGGNPRLAAASVRRYVALGDSYSSGEGAFGYLPGAPGRPAQCHRSGNAYSQLLAKRLLGGVQHDPARDFMACSGDEVPDLKNRQLAALGPDVAVITVGIGGNDSGWIDVIEQCMIDAATHPRPGSGKGCNHIIDDVFKQKLPELRGRLRDAYSVIKARAPQAKVIVLGYPAIFEDSYRSTFCASVGSLTRGARSDLRKAAGQLDGEIETIARSFGFRFVDPRGAFADHRICGPAEDWIHGVTFGRDGEPLISPQTFHPNPSGQRGFADAIAAANHDVFR
jgi:lysophospholipase L1-like esterase